MNRVIHFFLLMFILLALIGSKIFAASDSTTISPSDKNLVKETYLLAVGETHSFDKNTDIYITPKCKSGYTPYPMASLKESDDSDDSCSFVGLTRLNQQGCVSWDENEYKCSFRSENYYYSELCSNKGIRIYYWVWCY